MRLREVTVTPERWTGGQVLSPEGGNKPAYLKILTLSHPQLDGEGQWVRA